MTAALALFVVAAIALPHVLRLDRTSPLLAASIWLAALSLRAVVVLFGALLVVLYVPTTELFSAITHWCLHTILPMASFHLPLNGHSLGDAALLLPGLAVVASFLSVVAGLHRATRRAGKLVEHAIAGPDASVLVADREVLVAAAGIRRPRVVVSAGALLCFDDEELAASLEHERGHIARLHRYALLAAELCRGCARPLPGTRAAAGEFVFHLERDADRYALRRHHDPLALASAIVKAATTPPLGTPAVHINGGEIARRVELLLAGEPEPRRGVAGVLRMLATGMVALIVLSASLLPASAHASFHATGDASPERHCVDR